MTRKTYKPSVEVACAACGKLRRHYQCDIDNGEGKYCSKACVDEGQSVYAEIFAAVPGTIKQLAARVGTSEQSIVQPIRRLCQKGRLHAARLVQSGDGAGRRVLLVEFDAGPSPYPDVPAGARDALAYLMDRAIIEAMPGTSPQLAARSGIKETTVIKRIRDIRAAGKSHIKGWKRSTRHQAAVHAAGSGQDAPKLENASRAVRYQRYMKKVRSSASKLEQHNERMRENRRARLIRAAGDPLLNAFFGSPAERRARQNDNT